MSAKQRLVSELNEDELIDLIVARIGSAPAGEVWSGDDAALIHAPDETLVWTTDVLVEDVDFDLKLCAGGDVGWKALAANVSDVAAMGARATHALAALALRTDTSLDLVEAMVEGMVDAANTFDLALVGGDISSARELSLSISMLGAAVPGGPVRRSGARPGEAVCLTGALGGAAGGLIALREGRDDRPELVRRQLRPRARSAEAERLCSVGVTSMIDVSDGLAVDLGRLVRASGVGCRIEAAAVPVDPGLVSLGEASSGVDPLALALSGGEDFELLFTIEEANVDRAVIALEALGTPLTRIGTVEAEGRLLDGETLEAWEERGWDHLRGR